MAITLPLSHQQEAPASTRSLVFKAVGQVGQIRVLLWGRCLGLGIPKPRLGQTRAEPGAPGTRPLSDLEVGRIPGTVTWPTGEQ